MFENISEKYRWVICIAVVGTIGLMGLILGPILESNLRRALLISREGYWIFVDRPVSATLVAINVLLVIGALVYAYRQRRQKPDMAQTDTN